MQCTVQIGAGICFCVSSCVNAPTIAHRVSCVSLLLIQLCEFAFVRIRKSIHCNKKVKRRGWLGLRGKFRFQDLNRDLNQLERR